MQYEVIESKVWQSNTGMKVSIYGALPWQGEAERILDGWQMVTQGWTVRNPYTNEVGIGRAPWQTQAEAEEFAKSHKPSKFSMYC